MIGLDPALDMIVREFQDAVERYPKFASAHEGYAVVKEELEELWEEIKKNPKNRSQLRMREEAIQTAAMALRFLCDCCVEEGPRA